MTIFTGRTVSLWSTGMAVPERVMDNHELETLVDTNDKWIRERTGIIERRIAAPDENTSDLAAAAGAEALERAGLAPEELDMVLVATNTPDTIFPSVACRVQDRIGAVKAGASDIQTGCTSSISSLALATAGVASGLWENVLVIGAEVLSRLVDWEDRNTCVLFGDGAGAAVVGPQRDGEGHMISSALRSDGSKADLIIIPGGMSASPMTVETVADKQHLIKMKGNEVFKFVNRNLPPFLDTFCTDSGVEPESVDTWIFHQANLRIMDAVLKRIGVSPQKMYVNLDRYGNTSAASVFLALHEALEEERITKGQRVALTSFGSGMTYGAFLLEL